MLETVFGAGTPRTARYGSYRFGYAMLTWAIVGNVLQAFSHVIVIPLQINPQLSLDLFGVLFGLSTAFQLWSALFWVPLGLLLSIRDTADGKGLRNHSLEMQGRLGFSFIFITLTILLCEMSFR